ncbi:ABC transporter ATP-binding protein [Bacillus horti]|uniref:ATP-binding cassette subfamily B protein n=1 Tax=Caldalkalibacillus horti TaxID=77523 RepID=A0ABT9VWF0_9BACI|nr:ABC transporter ATP-binding protein [Bacillus horti]MDQ0165303.1 ATP-binding cassette subfamily B protein [Bacillus horti]
MLKFIGRMLTLSGSFSGRIKRAFVISFLESLFSNVPIFVVLYLLSKMLEQTLTATDAWLSFIVMAAALFIRILLRRLFLTWQSGTAYEICARERIEIGDRLKRFPMSHFKEGSIGNISSVISNDLLFIEEHGMNAMDKVINGYLSLAIGCIILMVLDWRIGLFTLLLSIGGLFSLSKLQGVGRIQSRIRQAQQAKLTSSVLEYVRGIAIIKSLNMTARKAKTLKDAIQSTRDHAIQFEETFSPPTIYFKTWFSVAIALTIFLASWFYLEGSNPLSLVLVLVIYVFYLFIPVQALAALTGHIRLMEAGLDRYEKLKETPIQDADSQQLKLDHYDITFNKVHFSYDEQTTLRDVSFQVPERSKTALVGMSGSGKTTIANLIVRFWDVQEGEVKIGGVNVKKMTNESLLHHISMVFQKVYLFQDTIYNNIKFGNPAATKEEIIRAARKARCHDFIMSLEQGYDTIVGEAGATLSGGEKQRISIARAILKDAPIILLDEATANVDPDNEHYIQQAIDELVKQKTVLVIAHRLSTIKSADQILVMDHGKLVQKGKHDELIGQEGIYKELWHRRLNARSWKITSREVNEKLSYL